MDFDTYQRKAAETSLYSAAAKSDLEVKWYPILGLTGEAGEIANKAKKILRDRKPLDKDDLKKELGDCLWYISEIARQNGIELDDVADANIEKLSSRYARGTIQGSGDTR